MVLNWNGYDDTFKCVESFRKSTYPHLRIIIVDNASTDGSYEKIVDMFNELKIIRSKKNGGYAAGMNLGIKEALKNNPEFILLVNNDIIVEMNFLEPLVQLALSNEKIGMISPKVLYQHNKNLIYSAGAEIDLLRCAGICKFQGQTAVENANVLRKISLAEGCFIMVKSSVFKQVGFLNEKYFMYFEDVEFSERVRKIFDIYYMPASIVYHKSGAGTSWQNYSSTYNYFFTRNRLFHYKDRNIFYRFYVILFSVSVSLAKSILILNGIIIQKHTRRQRFHSLRSLWSGIRAGFLLIFHIRHLE